MVVETQQVVSGKHFQLGPEEYITGALELYLDIMYILLVILEVIKTKAKTPEKASVPS